MLVAYENTPHVAAYGIKQHPWVELCGIKSARTAVMWSCSALMAESAPAAVRKVVIEALLPHRYIQGP